MTRLVTGIQAVRELLRARDTSAREVVLERSSNPKLEGIARLAASRSVPVRYGERRELDVIARGERHQGAAAEAADLDVLDRDRFLTEIEKASLPTVIILDGIMDPQNFGATVRSAVALGAPFVVWPEHAAAPLSPAMFRASAGLVEHARLCRVRALPDLILAMRDLGYTVVVLEGRAETTLEALDLGGPTAVVVGSEDKGSRGAVRKAATHLARLPIDPQIDSLNASVASALALYEIGRQRRASAS